MKIKQLIIGLVICVLCITMTQLPTVLAAEKSSSEDEYAFRWFYTFEGIPDSLRDGEALLEVIEVVEIFEEGVKIASSETKLECEKRGEILFAEAIVFTGEGYIECDTIDLREEVWRLSSRHLIDPLDICNGRESCPIPVMEVINKIDIVPPDLPNMGSKEEPMHPMLNGPIFVAPQVILGGGGTIANQHIITLKLPHSPLMQASIDHNFVAHQFELDITQSDLSHDFHVNEHLAARHRADQIVTIFTSRSETIYFGYNPSTNEYLTGSFYNGEFDPITGCSSCNDPH